MWNVRGISRPFFKPNARLLIQNHHPDLFILVETLVSRQNTGCMIKDLGFNSSHLVEPTGRAGGILLLWKADRIKVHILGENYQGVYALVEVSNSISFVITAIYASPKFQFRKTLWDDLSAFAAGLSQPWLVIGDFNEVTNSREKFGGRVINRKRVDLFVDTMRRCNLIDLGYHGPRFTWSNKRRHNPILERLDRGWANDAWITAFPNANLWHLPRVTSDHCPILLNLDNPTPNHGPKPFKFEPMWLKHPNFHPTVSEAWNNERGENVRVRLDHVRDSLILWNKTTFGDVFYRKRRVVGRLNGVQEALHRNPRSFFLQNLEHELEKEIIEILDQEEWLWFMKSRINWVTEGERNTNYFHKHVIIHRNTNRIMTIRNEVGESLESPTLIMEHIRSAFLKLYTTDHSCCPRRECCSDHSINVANEPSMEEIKQALFAMKPTKAP